MTDKQPEALRLSDELDAEAGRITQYTNRPGDLLRELAADELRRQYAELETLRTGYAAARLEIESLKVQIAERASHGQAPAGATLDVDIDAIALARYKVVPSHESMFHRFAVVAGDGEQQLYLGRETECQNMARKFVGAFLDGAFYQSQAKVPTPSPQAEDTQQAPAKAAPAAVAGPSEAVKFTDQSTADPVEKARRYLTAMGSNHLHSSYFFDDGYPKQESATDALATLAVMEHLAAAAHTTQPAPKQDPSQTAVQLAELVLSDCGHSSRYAPLLNRVTARINAHVERRLDELRGCLESRPLPAAQVDAALTQAARDVLAERQRQISAEGYDADHDDAHVNDEIAAMAALFVMPPGAREWDASSTSYGDTLAEAILPQDWEMPALGDRRRELVRGAAMALAELERIDRADAARAAQEGK